MQRRYLFQHSNEITRDNLLRHGHTILVLVCKDIIQHLLTFKNVFRFLQLVYVVPFQALQIHYI